MLFGGLSDCKKQVSEIESQIIVVGEALGCLNAQAGRPGP